MSTFLKRHKIILKQYSLKLLYKRFPIIAWLPKYTRKDALSDIIAGVTVGLTLMPQAIAYASLAGLSPEYGLYSALAGCFVYVLLGTCKEVSIGPTALLSLLTFNYTHNTNPDMAVLLCFLSGCVEFLCGFFQLGFLIEFVSVPVVAGFTSASALIIASSQVKGLLGLHFQSENFVETWIQIFTHINKTRLWDAVLGTVCIITLLFLRKLKDVKLYGKQEKSEDIKQTILGQVFFYLSIGKNALVVITCAIIASLLTVDGATPFLLSGEIEPGLPKAQPPPFYTSFGNNTLNFLDMCKHLGSGIAVVPFIAILGNIAIAKTFSAGEVIDGTQEMITLGVSNICGSFFHSIPTTGSFSRSAVNHTSGVKTPFGGLYTGIMMILALSLLTPYFYFIPKATLSSVIICAVIFMVEVQILPKMWRTSKKDLIPAIVSFLVCLALSVEMGILTGVIVDVALVMYSTARPKVHIENVTNLSDVEYILVTPNSGLLFPAIDYLRETVISSIKSQHVTNKSIPLVFDCKHIKRLDFSSFEGMQALIEEIKKNGHCVIFHNLKPNVAEIFRKHDPSKFLYSVSESELTYILKDLEMKRLREAEEHVLSIQNV